MGYRELNNMTHEQAKDQAWEILKPLNCEVIGKAIYCDGPERIMKSTKRFEVNHNGILLGWIYNTSTEYHLDGKVSIAEALVFVPLRK